MYLTYDEYLAFGGTVEETAFDNLEFEARTVIDWWTYNRLQNDEEYPEAVKRCMFKLINLIIAKQQAQLLKNNGAVNTETTESGIIQQSNDGVSTTYNIMSASEIIAQSGEDVKSTIRMYLQNVRNSLGRKVLYRGLYPGE
jgi:hypothetical protein